MRVLFIYHAPGRMRYLGNDINCERPVWSLEFIHHGISILSAILKEKGHQTGLIAVHRRQPKKFIDQKLDHFSPDVIAVTATIIDYAILRDFADYAKKRDPKVFTVIGGAHAQCAPEMVLNDGFDAVCPCEGDIALINLIESLDAGRGAANIQGIWPRSDKSYSRTSNPRFVEDLDSLPYADYSMWDDWIRFPNVGASLLVSRGCPFLCAYCSHHALKNVSEGKYVRFRSPKKIVDELYVFKERDVSCMYLESETLNVRKSYVERLCDELIKFNGSDSAPMNYGVCLRVVPNMDWDDLFSKMRAANFSFVEIGLESGSERIRESILKRRYSNELFEHVLASARRNGIMVGVYALIGIPGETLIDFRETIEVIKRTKPDRTMLSIFEPYPGTELYEVSQDLGLLQEGSWDYGRYESAINLPGFSKEQIQEQYSTFYEQAELPTPQEALVRWAIRTLGSDKVEHIQNQAGTYRPLYETYKDSDSDAAELNFFEELAELRRIP